MTRGYFVYEKNSRIVKAAYIPSDAYVGGDTCREILMAFYEGRELELLEKMERGVSKRSVEGIRPEWYRKTSKSKSDDYFEEYGSVLRGKTLIVYHYGEMLFSTKRGDAYIWAKISDNVQKFELTYLYSDEKLDYNWNQLPRMYRDLSERIKNGATYEELASTLRSEDPDSAFILTDSHMISSTYTVQYPSYVKTLRCGNGKEVKFYAEKFPGQRWHLLVQCPFVQIPVGKDFASEKACVNHLRTLIRENRDAMSAYADVCSYISEILTEMRIQEYSPEIEGKVSSLRNELKRKERSNPWFLHNTQFSIESIVKEVEETMALRKKRRRKQECSQIYVLEEGSPDMQKKTEYSLEPKKALVAFIMQDIHHNFNTWEYPEIIKGMRQSDTVPDHWYYDDIAGRRVIAAYPM